MDISLLIALVVSFFGAGHSALAKIDNESLPIIKYAVERAVEENINPKQLLKLINCESGFNSKAVGDKGKANGLLQFWKGTYDTYADIYGLEKEYKNPYSQIDLASKMLSDGLWKHWYNCGKIAGYGKRNI